MIRVDDKMAARTPSKIKTMRIPLFHVDAFAEGPFSGNPAAVCLLDSWLDDGSLAKVATENNLSATAFLVPKPGSTNSVGSLRGVKSGCAAMRLWQRDLWFSRCSGLTSKPSILRRAMGAFWPFRM